MLTANNPFYTFQSLNTLKNNLSEQVETFVPAFVKIKIFKADQVH